MTPAQAASVWILTTRIIKGVEKANDAAAKILKAHCAAKKLTTYRGIGYSATATTYLAVDLARAALGPEQSLACSKRSTRATLTLPAGVDPIVPAELRDVAAP